MAKFKIPKRNNIHKLIDEMIHQPVREKSKYVNAAMSNPKVFSSVFSSQAKPFKEWLIYPDLSEDEKADLIFCGTFGGDLFD